MPTGYFELFPAGGLLPDGSSGNVAGSLQSEKSTGTPPTGAPNVHKLKYAVSVDDWMTFQATPRGRSSADDGTTISAATVRIKFKMVSATTGNVRFAAGQVSIVESSTDDDAVAYAALDNSGDVAVPGTQGQVKEATVTLTNTNMQVGRLCELFAGRDAAGASEATGDAEILSIELEYTF